MRGHPVTTAVAMETLRIYEEIDMLGHVQEVGPYLQQAAAPLADHPLVGDVRGVGMIAALEMVADKDTRAPFDPALKVGAIADRYAREHGLIARFIGDRIAFSPPLIITEAEIDEVACSGCGVRWMTRGRSCGCSRGIWRRWRYTFPLPVREGSKGRGTQPLSLGGSRPSPTSAVCLGVRQFGVLQVDEWRDRHRRKLRPERLNCR